MLFQAGKAIVMSLGSGQGLSTSCYWYGGGLNEFKPDFIVDVLIGVSVLFEEMRDF